MDICGRCVLSASLVMSQNRYSLANQVEASLYHVHEQEESTTSPIEENAIRAPPPMRHFHRTPRRKYGRNKIKHKGRKRLTTKCRKKTGETFDVRVGGGNLSRRVHVAWHDRPFGPEEVEDGVISRPLEHGECTCPPGGQREVEPTPLHPTEAGEEKVKEGSSATEHTTHKGSHEKSTTECHTTQHSGHKAADEETTKEAHGAGEEKKADEETTKEAHKGDGGKKSDDGCHTTDHTGHKAPEEETTKEAHAGSHTSHAAADEETTKEAHKGDGSKKSDDGCHTTHHAGHKAADEETTKEAQAGSHTTHATADEETTKEAHGADEEKSSDEHHTTKKHSDETTACPSATTKDPCTSPEDFTGSAITDESEEQTTEEAESTTEGPQASSTYRLLCPFCKKPIGISAFQITGRRRRRYYAGEYGCPNHRVYPRPRDYHSRKQPSHEPIVSDPSGNFPYSKVKKSNNFKLSGPFDFEQLVKQKSPPNHDLYKCLRWTN